LVGSDTIISAISAFAASGALIYNAFSYIQTSRNQYLQLVKSVDDEITALETSKEREENHFIFSQKYLNVHERLAYLGIKKLIPKDVVRYFQLSFERSRGLLALDEFKQTRDQYIWFNEWCKREKIKVGRPLLPE
jgi:hypothetical protein